MSLVGYWKLMSVARVLLTLAVRAITRQQPLVVSTCGSGSTFLLTEWAMLVDIRTLAEEDHIKLIKLSPNLGRWVYSSQHPG
jgi:hypothetical protein